MQGSSFKEGHNDSSMLQAIVYIHKHQGTAKFMKVMGLITYIAKNGVTLLFFKRTKHVNIHTIALARKGY